MAVAALLDLPGTHQFEPAAYSNVAKHRFRTPQDLNIEKLKAEARDGWAIAGGNRLVKVLPAVGHNTAMPDELQYPPGEGAPQWILEVPMRAKVVAVVTGYPQGRYRPAEAAGV
jgi:hypothetical protein